MRPSARSTTLVALAFAALCSLLSLDLALADSQPTKIEKVTLSVTGMT